MKFYTFILLIVSLVLSGCFRKSAPQLETADSKNEIFSIAQSESEAQSELAASTVIEQETQSAEIDSWSNEDKRAIQDVRRRVGRGVGGATLAKPMGTWKFYYNAGRNDERRVLAPVATFDDEEMYEQYPFLMKGDPKYMVQCSSTDDFSAMTFKERDRDDCITVLFTTNQFSDWATTRIKIDDRYLASGFPYFHIFCISPEVGYLTLCSKDDAVGGSLYRTKDSGASWELVGEVPASCNRTFSAQGDTVYLNASKGRFFRLFKSDDYMNWEEIDFPIDTEKYESGHIYAFRFEGDYGIVEAALFCPNLESIAFATKDGGKTWIAWDN
ncbi:MAG: hypothetical protein K2I95_09840 [Treponemataceae bacterium]|nr:hypothetical protein [Treponemataceae bacterium]